MFAMVGALRISAAQGYPLPGKSSLARPHGPPSGPRRPHRKQVRRHLMWWITAASLNGPGEYGRYRQRLAQRKPKVEHERNSDLDRRALTLFTRPPVQDGRKQASV